MAYFMYSTEKEVPQDQLEKGDIIKTAYGSDSNIVRIVIDHVEVGNNSVKTVGTYLETGEPFEGYSFIYCGRVSKDTVVGRILK